MNDYIYTNTEVTKHSIQQLYRNKLQLSFAKFARSITLNNTSVRIELTDTPSEAPAWSTDKDIHLEHLTTSGSVLSMDNLIRLKGLLIHELSHLLFTPRSRTDLASWVRLNDKWNAFNILEDNRIENMMVAKMSGITPWLTHAITKELLSNPSDVLSAHPLVWGRKYLPSSVRTAAMAAWPHQTAQDIADVIDEYIKLNLADTKSAPRAKQLIEKLHSLLPYTKPLSHGHQQDATPKSGAAATQTKSQQDKLLNQVDDIDDEANDTEGNGGEDAGNAGDLTESLKSASQAAAEQVYDDVKSTIQSVRDVESGAITHADSDSEQTRRAVTPVGRYHIAKEPVMPDATVASRKFARELQELRASHDPGWLRKTESGRLNVRDYMLGNDIETVFDQWSDGNQDVTDIECVILLDNSGSMHDMITPAYNAMWSVKRALDSINASTTVIQFGTYGEVLYSADSHAGPTMLTARQSGGGGTAPFFSLKHAKDILDSSSRAIKIMLVITDGQWFGAKPCDELILGMRMSGILTSLVFLMPPTEDGAIHYWLPRQDNKYVIDGHNCEVVTALDSPLDIVTVAKSITNLAQRRVLN